MSVDWLLLSAVSVSPPWKAKTFVPTGSIVQINCTAEAEGQLLHWSIRPNGSISIVYNSDSKSRLESNGYAQVQESDYTTIHIRVNITHDKNNTLLSCFYFQLTHWPLQLNLKQLSLCMVGVFLMYLYIIKYPTCPCFLGKCRVILSY